MRKLRIFVDFAMPSEAFEILQSGTEGHELVLPQNPVTSVLAKPEADPQFATVDVAFGQPDPDAIAGAPRLKWIQVSSSGITRYDNPAFRTLMAERDIAVCNSASVYNEACATHALSFILAQARKLPASLGTRTANGTEAWTRLRASSSTLRGETLLILGFGAIGRRLTELLHPFGMNILAYRRRARGDEGVPILLTEQLTDALGTADHVVNVLPDSAETRHFFNRTRFGAMKQGATFYNIGRGTTVDQEALLESLRSARLGAAWLDVTEPEPLPEGHPLWDEPNCFLTPHVAGGHAGEATTLVRHFLNNLDRFVQGEPLGDRVM